MYGVSGPDGFGFESLTLFDPAGAFAFTNSVSFSATICPGALHGPVRRTR